MIRTVQLLRYLSDAPLCWRVTAATNKVEAFNGFSQWIGFGQGGVITDNDRTSLTCRASPHAAAMAGVPRVGHAREPLPAAIYASESGTQLVVVNAARAVVRISSESGEPLVARARTSAPSMVHSRVMPSWSSVVSHSAKSPTPSA